MKYIYWLVIFLSVSLPQLAWGGNKKSAPRSSGGHAAHAGGGGGMRSMGGAQHNFHGASMHNNNSFGGSHNLHSQGFGQSGHAQRNMGFQHGLNGSHGLGTRSLNGQHSFSAQHTFRGNALHGANGFNRGNFHAASTRNWQGSHSLRGSARWSANHAYTGNWHGAHFRSYHEAFSGYHRLYHDHYWWHNHYNRIVLVGGGYYYWNAGYWYPAWGYDPTYVSYVYDGPIYSYNNLPPDQVIVNVQDSLQDQGYYTGTVDGQLGPATRDALAAYQKDHGLEVTSAVDEPTVESLGLANEESQES